jgi:hypothetical protein
MDGDENGIDRALAHDPDSLGDRIPVQYRETAAAGRVHPGAFDREQHRGNGGRPFG